MWIQREIEQTLRVSAGQRAALLVTGCRQAGKTSLLTHVFPEASYVSLDLPTVAEEAEEDGKRFLERHSEPLIVDEVQYAPRLFRYLKSAIDSRRGHTGRFFLTGSQKFGLMSGVSESLAGRITVLECHPLNLRELERFYKRPVEGDLLWDLILKGGYPAIHSAEIPHDRFYSDYVATYLERDVRQVIQVRNLRDFDRFLRLLATRSGQLLSMNSFAADLGVSPHTIRSWLSVLEASSIVVLLEPYFRNLGKRIVKTPKLYFLDTGLLCYLLGIRTAQELLASQLCGAIFETAVLIQIVRTYANRGERCPVYFYRDHDGHEVDFVIPVGEKLKLLECKLSEGTPPHLKSFDELARLIGESNIVLRTVITPARQGRALPSRQLRMSNPVDMGSLLEER